MHKSAQSVKNLSSSSETLHEALCNKNIRIPHPKNNWGRPLSPALCYNWADKGGYFQNLSYGSETSDMTSEGFGEMLEGDSADMCGRKFPLMSMGGSIGMSGILYIYLQLTL